MNIGEGAMPCYWLEPNGLYRIGLRRFTFTPAEDDDSPSHVKCPASTSGHDGSTLTEIELPVEYDDHDNGYRTMAPIPKAKEPKHNDPRWPKVCDHCGERFPRGAEWQAYQANGYVRSDNGETVWTRHVMGKEFAGALYDSWWYRQYKIRDQQGNLRGYVGPDGIALTAVCPNGGTWTVDGPSSSGGGWTRTGNPKDPPTLTVQPSIVCGAPGDPDTYHGFLTNGRFTGHVG